MFLHPSLLAFDASTREECVVERPRSNTPLQALVLLNDPTYVEAARAFAARMIREGGADAKARIERGFQLALSRPPRAREVPVLLALLRAPLRPVSGRPDGGARLARPRGLRLLRRTSTRSSWRPGPPSPACS